MNKELTAANIKAMEARGREVMAANMWSDAARQASAEARKGGTKQNNFGSKEDAENKSQQAWKATKEAGKNVNGETAEKARAAHMEAFASHKAAAQNSKAPSDYKDHEDKASQHWAFVQKHALTATSPTAK